jgi:hypothetical protein
VPRGCREGEFPDAELGMELVTSQNAARDTMDMATDLETRYPHTRQALAAGLIDEDRARIIWRPTRCLSDADAAYADELLAGLAPRLRYDQLARKATAVAMKLDPEAFKRGKEQARADRQRVAAGREDSGNAFLSGRELATEDVLASKAHIDALAAALRRGGLPGTLRHLRVLAYVDLTQGRDPLGRLTGPRPAGPAGQAGQGGSGSPAVGHDSPGDAPEPHGASRGEAGTGEADGTGGHDSTDTVDGDSDDDASWDGCPDMTQWQHERRGTTEDDDHHDDGPGARPGPPAPFPAMINLTVPAGTAYGWSTAPGDIGGWGLLDPDDTRRLLQAASMHPRTRWRVTPLAPNGTALAHGRARGPHPWIPPPATGGGTRDGPDTRQAAALAELLRDLNVTLTPIAKDSCDHASREDRYTPSRTLTDLIRARTARCTAPGCAAHAASCDLDHTHPYPAGITCQCDLAPACRRHHRCKQAPGWQLTQPQPGIMHWTTPSGRSYTTKPTVYDV